METGSIWGLILGFGSALFGVLALVVGVRDHREARASQRWPAVPGRVTRCAPTLGPPDQGCAAYVSYAYEVGGLAFAGDRVAIPDEALECGICADRYAVDIDVAVYHDPARPDRATLVPGYRASAFARVVVVAGAWLAVGFAVLVNVLRDV